MCNRFCPEDTLASDNLITTVIYKNYIIPVLFFLNQKKISKRYYGEVFFKNVRHIYETK